MFLAGPKKLTTSIVVALFPANLAPERLIAGVLSLTPLLTTGADETDSLVLREISPDAGKAPIMVRNVITENSTSPIHLQLFFFIFNPSELSNVLNQRSSENLY
jgi:hypothetical protein